MARKQFPLLLLLLISVASHAQNILNIKMGANPVDASTTLILRDIEEQHGIRFFYLDSWFENSRVEIDFSGLTLQEALTEITRGTDLSFTVLDNYAIIFSKDPTQALQRREILTDAARGRKKIDNTVIGDPASPKPGNEVVLTGRIIDEKTKEAIAGVSVYVNDMEKGTITDPDGNYRMTMSKGEHIITYSYVNYEEKLTDLRIYNDGKIDVNLEEVPRLLDEVVISDRANREIVTSSVGQTQI
ncbi:MAG: carboxypeptidase-like regulatory domain-containing protein, partial [Cyclobacteriaceae bacterium]